MGMSGWGFIVIRGQQRREIRRGPVHHLQDGTKQDGKDGGACGSLNSLLVHRSNEPARWLIEWMGQKSSITGDGSGTLGEDHAIGHGICKDTPYNYWESEGWNQFLARPFAVEINADSE